MIFLAVILAGFFPKTPFFTRYFPFAGTLLVVAANWLMFRSEGKDLNHLGLGFSRYTIGFLFSGLLFGVLAFAGGYYLKTLISGETWIMNGTIDYEQIAWQVYWILPTAAVQQLMIRGYCFTKLVQMSTPFRAILISGLVFIGMHDFWNGNAIQFITYAATLFIGHYLFSEAFLRTGTLLFSIGLHWGNNLANSVLFTEGRKATSLFYTTNAPVGFMGLPQFVTMFIAMNLGFIFLIVLIRRRVPSVR